MIYPALTDGKTPALKFVGRSTARKRPIGSNHNQWGRTKSTD
ncbi:hypothetical protein P4313_04505 [Bacillus tropicus]|nr:hypothetical protein [Bacillus cereus]MED3034308.1 hypothetical protein [Bacillus tropicus]